MIKDLWYKNAIVYCLHVGTFMDSNGDGVGDFEGLVRRLDYLAGLGVNALWLHPFQKSPKRDDGYDISDFYQVDSVYGTLGDFVEFTHEAKQRGIRVLSTKGVGKKRHVERFGMLRDIREFLQWRRGDAVILAEANVLPEDDMEYFGEDADRMHMMFNFQVNQHLFYALASGDVRPLVKALVATKARPQTAQWGIFLRNHDELDLGRLSESQRERVFSAFAPERDMQLYGRGIRRRLATMLCGDRRRMELAYSLLFGLPGTPILRYGDELGMGDDLRLPERNATRTPMQWSTEPHAGFTRAKRPILPVIADGPYGFHKLNAAEQRREPGSLLNWIERMIRMRKEVPEIGWGDFRVLEVAEPGILALRYEWRNDEVLVIHNFRDVAVQIELALGKGKGGKLVNLLTGDHSDAGARGRHRIVMEPFGYHWYRVGGLGYLLERSSV